MPLALLSPLYVHTKPIIQLYLQHLSLAAKESVCTLQTFKSDLQILGCRCNCTALQPSPFLVFIDERQIHIYNVAYFHEKAHIATPDAPPLVIIIIIDKLRSSCDRAFCQRSTTGPDTGRSVIWFWNIIKGRQLMCTLLGNNYDAVWLECFVGSKGLDY